MSARRAKRQLRVNTRGLHEGERRRARARARDREHKRMHLPRAANGVPHDLAPCESNRAPPQPDEYAVTNAVDLSGVRRRIVELVAVELDGHPNVGVAPL